MATVGTWPAAAALAAAGPGREVAVGSDTGAGWQGDVTPPDEPPPTPFERAPTPGGPDAVGATGVTPAMGVLPRRRRGRTLLLLALAVALVAAGALVLDGRRDALPAADPAGDAEADPAADAALLDLLAAVDASELAMLGFDEAAGEAFDKAASEDEALALVAAAAEVAAAELASGRDGLDDPLAVGAAEDVRAAYLPHLDAWIAYLEAVAADPEVLFGPAQEALILRINATAGVFAAALESTVAAGVGPEVEAAARDILDRGFPDQEDADL